MEYLYSSYQDIWINGQASPKEKEFKTSSKTEEEMKKLTIEESFSEIQKAIFIMNKGQNFQKFAIYSQLPQLIKETEAQGKFIQLIFDDLLTQEEEIQIEAAKSFNRILKEKLLEKPNEIKLFGIVLKILKIWSQPILLAWAEVFHEILNIFPYQNIEKDCYQLISILSDHSQPKSSRYIAGILIGMVSEKIKENFPSSMIERVRGLCQDSDIEIRKIMADEVLEKICFSIGTEKTEIYILEKLMELVYDGEINVKCAAIRLVFRIIDCFSPETKANRISMLFIELLSSINEEVLKVISKEIGFILSKLEIFLKRNPSYISSILSTFKDYGISKNEEIRRNFSFNLPAILFIIDSKQFENYRTIYLSHLLAEKSFEVRITAVSSLHAILGIIGYEEAHKTFKDVIKSLFKEGNTVILKKIGENLNAIFEAFWEENEENEELKKNLVEILGMVVGLGYKFHKENQWREQNRLLGEFLK